MRYLLLLLGLLVLAPNAMAQWTFAGDFPGPGNAPPVQNVFNNVHGLAVDPDGKVWVQNYFAQTGDSVKVDPFPEVVPGPVSAPRCRASTKMCAVTVLHVYNADGTKASFSPLSIVTLPGGTRDTLGGGAFRTGTGASSFDYNTGRGITSGPDGNIYAGFGGSTTLYKFDYKTGAVLDFVPTTQIAGSTGPSVDRNGNVYITAVVPGGPIAIYDRNLDYIGNVVDKGRAFNRTLLALPDGNSVILPNYSADIATIYQRPDEFSAYDSVGVTFEGMSVEAITIHPTTGNIWASAGSPNDPPAGRYQPHTWYEFTVADVLANRKPTPLDSIKWNNPAAGRPRAIAFSPDGRTAYVGEFSSTVTALQKFVKGTTSLNDDLAAMGVTLEQNRPNPFSNATDITFSLQDPAYARLRVLDMTGREVALLVDSQLAAGPHTATFQSGALAAGVYLYILEVDGLSTSRRMLHVR